MTNDAQRNIACIAARFPDLHRQLLAHYRQEATGTAAAPPSKYRWQAGRKQGGSIQFCGTQGWISLYSVVDPQREAVRAAERISGDGAAGAGGAAGSGAAAKTERCALIVATLLGNGHLIEELLARMTESEVIVVIDDLALLSCALSARDLRPLLQHPRLTLDYLADPAGAQALIARLYLPVLHGRARLLWNEPLITHSDTARAMRDALQRAISSTYSAVMVYRRLGRVWFRNILLNGATLARAAAEAGGA